MNNIKRKKEEKNRNLLNYKFGINKKEISKKLIITSEINKRIIFDTELLLHKCIILGFPEEILKLVSKKELDISHNILGTPLILALEGNYSDEFIMTLITEENLSIKGRSKYPFQIAMNTKRSEKLIKSLIETTAFIEKEKLCGEFLYKDL